MDFAYPSLQKVKLFFDKDIENELCLWVAFSGCWDKQNFQNQFCGLLLIQHSIVPGTPDDPAPLWKMKVYGFTTTNVLCAVYVNKVSSDGQ